MRALALAVLLMFAFARADELVTPATAGKAARARLDLGMSDPAIRQAVRATLAGEKPAPARADGQALRGDAYRSFARQVDEAAVPDCLHQDALKFQPPQVGPIPVVGVLALPFVAVAALRGKCR